MYTYSTLPTPVRLIPLTILLFTFFVGGAVARAMIAAELPPVSPPAGSAAPSISPLFTPEVQYWADEIARWSEAHSLDPNLVATVMQIESCGNPEAVSSSGAQGLFQVMPFHFAEGEAMRDPDTNAQQGLDYLARGLALANNQPGLALAGYNGGHSQITKVWGNWPAETKRYYYWGSGIYAEVSAGGDSSPTLNEWLNAGGASLCEKAKKQLAISD
ncbi:MAG: lytic transglycosylase domain-containing protein [Chloroflexi bacterium]|nr:lytic transglycosylase domain-containing protein [Chloroflexota bacterium]